MAGQAGSWVIFSWGILGMLLGCSWDFPGTFLERSWSVPGRWGVGQPSTGWAGPGGPDRVEQGRAWPDRQGACQAGQGWAGSSWDVPVIYLGRCWNVLEAVTGAGAIQERRRNVLGTFEECHRNITGTLQEILARPCLARLPLCPSGHDRP